MSLPTLEKTWIFNVNNAQGALGTGTLSNRQILFQIKQALIGSLGSWTNASGGSIASPSTLLWTVAYSCDSSTAGTAGDGVDRWTAATNLVTASGAHSWIVLKNTHVDQGGNFQVCIDLPNTDGTQGFGFAAIIVSRTAGFTGGTTSSRPTATDEFVLNPTLSVASLSAVPMGQFSIGGYGYTLHYLMSSDGFIHRILITNGSICQVFLGFGQSADVDWTPNVVVFHAACGFVTDGLSHTFGPYDGPLYAGYGVSPKQNGVRPQWNSPIVSYWGCAGLIANGGFQMSMSARGFGNTYINNVPVMQHYINSIGTQPNALSNDYLIEPVGLTADSSTAYPGRHGNATDLWWSNAPAGSTYPASGTPQFAQLGSLMVPWNGSSPVI